MQDEEGAGTANRAGRWRHRLLLVAGALLVLLVAGGVSWLWTSWQQALERPLTIADPPLVIDVEPGMTIKQVAALLERRGLMRTPRWLELEARRLGKAHRIQSGEYELARGTTPRGLLDMLIAGRVRHHQLTLLEGWTFGEVRSALEGHEAVRQTLAGLDDGEVMARLGHPGEHPEGRFFPDTYHFIRDTPDVELLATAYRKMARTLEREWSTRDAGLPYEDPYEALIMASIVEKETGVAAERARIAGVFVRRLERGMRLQTDPTVIYGMGTDFDGNLRRRDLGADTPYNTYRVRGLPPTPIAMPGLGSIRAALHPAPGEALYFVSRGDGTHHFSASLEEHNRAVTRYQRRGDD